MKALIVLENHFFLDDDNNVWCDRVVDYDYLKRYLNVFKNIIVTGRTKKIENLDEKKLLVSGEGVEFVPMPDFKGAKGLLRNLFALKNIIKETTKQVNCVIYRAPTHIALFTYNEVIKQHKTLGLEFMMAADKMFDGDGIIKKILNRIIDKKAQKMCLKADGVAYVTEKILQKKYPCKALVNSTNSKYFTTNYSSIDLEKDMYYKQNWNINDKPNIYEIIHTGYMDSYRKGQKVLLEAIKIVKDRGYNIRLTLIGDGIKREEFENLADDLGISEIVDFKGLIKNKQKILNILRKSHLFVFPTQSEGLPRTIIEAMSQGLPCISSPVDGIPELVEKEFLVKYDDITGYTNKIIELLNNWDRMIEVSERNYKKSLEYEKSILEERRNTFYKFIKEISSNGTNKKK